MKLEEYISTNASAFDTECPPEGAEERFLRKLDAVRPRVRILRAVLPAAAAAVLAVLLLLPPAGHDRDWLRDAGDTPEGIYLSYMGYVSEAWDEAGADEVLAAQLRSLTEEAIPLIDQLPAELDEASRADIVREHYNTLLNGVHVLMDTTK